MKLKISEKLTKKRAFITGAASGLGKALCMQLAGDGWTIVMSDINVEQLEAAANEVREAGGQPLVFELDVSNLSQYQKVVKTTLDNIEGIDLLINNAGVGDGNLLREYDIENWEWLMRINLFGVMYGFRLFIDNFSRLKKSNVISIASAAGFSSAPGMSAYNVSKAGVISLSETMQYELSPYNTSVSVVMPTFFKTNVMQQARGKEYVHYFAEKMMSMSTTNAAEMSKVILEKAAKDRLYIVHPGQAKIGWWLKRHFPAVLRGQIRKAMQPLLDKHA